MLSFDFSEKNVLKRLSKEEIPRALSDEIYNKFDKVVYNLSSGHKGSQRFISSVVLSDNRISPGVVMDPKTFGPMMCDKCKVNFEFTVDFDNIQGTTVIREVRQWRTTVPVPGNNCVPIELITPVK